MATPTRPRRTVRELIARRDPEFLASCRRTMQAVRESLERLATLEPWHPDLIDRDDDGAILEVHHPDAIRKALERALAAPAAARPEPAPPVLSAGAKAALRHLELLGKDPARTWFRAIRHGRGANGRRRGADLQGFDADELRADAAAGANLYFVVGEASQASGKDRSGRPTGAVIDRDITAMPALFIEWDEGDLADQLTAWQRLGLPEPTLMLNTGGKSAHLFWRLREPVPAAEWKVATARLIAHCKSDRACSNPSRVMRLAGSSYIDKKTGQPTGARAEIVHEAPEAVYDLAEILTCLPAPEPTPAAPAPTSSRATAPATSGSDLPPRDLQQVLDALQWIPSRVPGHGHYGERDRPAALGFVHAVREAGGSLELALAHLQAHHPQWPDLEQVVCSSDLAQWSAGTFWHHVKQHGGDASRPELRRQQHPQQAHAVRHQQQAGAAPAPGEPTGLAWLLQRLDTGVGPAGARKTTAGDLAQTLMLVAGDRLRFNEQSLVAEIDGEPIEGPALDTLHVELQLRGMNIAAEATVDAVATAAHQHPYHPVREYLDTVGAAEAIEPLDLTALVGQFLRPGDPPGTLHGRMLAKTLIAAVARAYQPGCKLDTCCTLVGGQGVQKSSFWEALASPAFYSSSSVASLDKDALLLVHATWFLEAAELETVTSKRAAGELKNFLSTAVDCFRVPYGRSVQRRPRPSVMVGTSNRNDFLTDETGSRRFWIIPVTAPEIDVAGVKALRDRIWRSAVLAYRAGERWWLDKADAAASELENQSFTASHPWEAPVATWLEGQGGEPFSTIDCLTRSGLRDKAQISRRDEMALATVLAGLGWKQDRVRHGARRVRLWVPAQAAGPTWPDRPNLKTARSGHETASDCSGSQGLSQPAQPISNKDLPDVGPVGGTGTERSKGTKKGRAGWSSTEKPASAVDLTGPTCSSEVGPGRSEVGPGAPRTPSTVTQWVERALGELRLAPHLMHLPEVLAWVRQHPDAPAISQTQLAGALDRLRQADQETDQLGLEVQP